MEAQAGAGDDAATIVMKDTRNNLLRTGYDSPIGRRVYLRNIQESSQSAAHTGGSPRCLSTGTGTLVIQHQVGVKLADLGLYGRGNLSRGRRGKARQLTVAVAVASPS